MQIARSPVRLTFGGGGTDIASYYTHSDGFIIAAGINKYSWVMVNRGYYDYIHLKYSKEEKVQVVKEISHPIIREMLKLFACVEPVEITSMADYPTGSGLGTSGSFAVALAKCLSDYYGKHNSYHREIAELACHVEIDLLGDPIGKQDQYASAFGGINAYTFNSNGYVTVEPLEIKNLETLEQNLLLFDTQIPRKSSDVLTNQVKDMELGGETLNRLDKVKEMTYEMRELLESGKLDEWGSLLNDYWQERKKVAHGITNPVIDEAYEEAIKCGALGGKLQGAGGGGFLMFYAPANHEDIIDRLTSMGLKHFPFKFDFEGVHSWSI